MDNIYLTTDHESIIKDEVALEGLDGITIQALWVRLETRPNLHIRLDDDQKKYLWDVCIQDPNFQFYELPEPRPPLIIKNQSVNVDDEDVILDTEDTAKLYPFCEINEQNVYGSCATFYTRVNITNIVKGIGTDSNPLSLEEAESRWCNKLVIVASNELRRKALFGEQHDPLWQCNGLHYIMLERIGRSRYQGEFTCGKNSLSAINSCAKSLFYYRISLLSKGIVNKQFRYCRTKEGHVRCLLLLHLNRFFVEHKPRMVKLTEEIVKFLVDRPGRMETVANIRDALRPIKRDTLKKCLKKIAETKTISYEDFVEYTGHTSEKMTGNNKNINVVVLHDNVTLENLDIILERNLMKEEGVEEESLDEVGPGLNKKNFASDRRIGVPDYSRQIIEKPILHQAYELFDQLGSKGSSVIPFAHILGVPRLEARMICNNLQRLKLVSITRRDMGKQRVSLYVAKSYVADSRQEIYIECKRLIEHLSDGEILVSANKNPVSDEILLKQKLKELVKMNERKRKFKKNEKRNKRMEQDDSENTFEKDTATKNDDLYASIKNAVPLLDDIMLLLDNNTRSISTLTVKTLKRINIILNAVRKAKMIDSHVTLYKLIVNQEIECANSIGKMALKSFQRLLGRLDNEGFINTVTENIKCGDREKQIFLICDSTLTSSDPMILSAIEQAKLKFQATTNVVIVEDKTLDNINSSVTQLRNLHKKGNDRQSKSYNRHYGRFYGYEPKFIRCRLFYEFLYYVTYGYDGSADIKPLPETFDCDINTLPKIYYYNSEPSWKMFVSPLPEHYGWDQGWCLMSDILLRLPLSMLIRIVCYNFKMSGIEEYIDHPIKKHIPICYLPLELRNQLLFSRKYIHSSYEIGQKLYYMGLLSFGPTEHKSKDMVFLYVHRKGRVVDTTMSPNGYYKVSADVDYPIRKYEFDSVGSVDSYWNDLETVCRNTALGFSYVPADKELLVEIEPVDKKIPIKSVLPTETSEVDVGVAPGDCLGAGGLDSSFFSHLHRSWNWLQPAVKAQKLKSLNAGKRKSPSKLSKCASVRFKSGSPEQLHNVAKTSLLRLVINKQLEEILPENKNLPEVKQPKKLPSHTILKKSKTKVIRKIKPRKPKRSRAPMYDDTDLKALSVVKSKRVRWYPKEDSLLLLGKVAYVLMFDNRRSGISCRLIRDFLHRHSKASKDKTAMSCARRIVYMLKNIQTGYHVSVYVGEARQDKEISELCEGLNLLSPVTQSEIFKERFKLIMDKLMTKFKSITKPSSNSIILPSTLKELYSKFNKTFAKNYWGKSSDIKDCVAADDITENLAYSLILSAIAGFTSDEKQLSVQLYDVFKRFPDSILLKAFNSLKSTSMVCSKKRNMQRKKVTSSPVFGTLTYRMSIQYTNLLRSKYPEDIYAQISDVVNELHNNAREMSPQPINMDLLAGYTLAIAALTVKKKINFEVIIPDDVVTLDPAIFKMYGEKAEDVEELSERLEDEPPLKKQKLEDGSSTSNHNASAEISCNRVVYKAASKSSRLALYMLRKKIVELNTTSFQHLQAYLRLKPCTVNCMLNKNCEEPMEIDKIHRDIQEYLPLKSITLSDIINHYQELCRTETEIQEMVAIYNIINECGKLGIDCENLKLHYASQSITSLPLDYHLKEMESIKGILCVGVATLRYVAHPHISNWQLRSYQLVPTFSNQEGVASTSSVDTHSSSSTMILMNRKEVDFIPAIWRRPDGTLNFPVFRQLLLSIFGQIMSFSGMSFEKTYIHYRTIFTPVQLRELINILIDLGCVNKIQPNGNAITTLFSPLPTYTPIVNGSDWSYNECYEVDVEGPHMLISYLNNISMLKNSANLSVK